MGDHKSQAKAKIEDISNGINTLKIRSRRSKRRPRKSLGEALHSFDESAVTLSEQAATVVKLLCADGTLKERDAESICLVQTRGLQLARLAQLLIDSAIPALVRQVICLDAKTTFAVDDLLEYFKKPIENITQGVIGTSGSDDVLWKMAVECYCQAASPSGELNPVHYLASRKPPESEDKEEDWVNFWICSLCKFSSDPTLFEPKRNFIFGESNNKPPERMARYLFRTYDKHSMGLNTDKVIASVLSVRGEASRYKVDMLSMDRQEASEMLHHHLHKGRFSTLETRNIVSWSSSLIFVIQYANYRFCNPEIGPPGDIHICALDTSKFPRGQFARDKWLLNWFSSARLSDDEISFRNLRLNISDYNNGEYLSQGKLHIEGRSCTLSVQGLANAGLWDLYPAFNVDDAEPTDPVRKKWPKYVKYLRHKWLAPRKTTKTEVQCALNIAQECFPGFEQDDMALLLLSFRERKLHRENPSFQNPFADELLPVSVDDAIFEEPAEVNRYSTLRKRLSELSEASGERGMRLFEQLYELEDT
ncbi:hypothetical protein FAGAP_11341 [Fusarium agapanthi]|uniref:DUF7587 domain-containing protein n=1 Tax=Fusarium agapanthi TaxID=1803897 RepID=A0A9P5B5W1_9HYPO|nr:hypothetical protein FAGAP_11341 [Fusarium agapanthi]